MAEKEVVVREVRWRDMLGVAQLLRAFRIALWPMSKLVLCLGAVVLTVGLGILLDQGFDTRVYTQSFRENMTDVYRAATGYVLAENKTFMELTPEEREEWREARNSTPDLKRLHPSATADPMNLSNSLSLRGFWYGPIEAIRHAGRLVVQYWQNHKVFTILNVIIALLTWTFVAGAVSRLVAMQYARDERPGMLEALRFACKRYASLAASPVALFIVLALVAVPTAFVASLVLLIPYVGELVTGVLFFLVLGVGVLLTFLFLFGAASLGLQAPAIGVEGRDAFDAVSRGVQYVFKRPWKYILYTLFSLLYLSYSFVLVRVFAWLGLKLPHAFLALWPWIGGGEDGPGKLERVWAEPSLYELFRMPAEAGGTEYVAAVLIGILVVVWLGLMVSYIPSFLITSQTIIYFLLRRQVDFKELDEVYVEEEEEEEEEEEPETPLERTETTEVEPEPGASSIPEEKGGEASGQTPPAGGESAESENEGGSSAGEEKPSGT